MKEINTITIYTDGAVRGNPNSEGSAAYVIYYNKKYLGEATYYSREDGTKDITNNQMEMLAVINALESPIFKKVKVNNININCDSKLIVDAFNQKWLNGWIKRGWRKSSGEPVLNVPLWKLMLSALEGRNYAFHYVKGHAGNPGNELADSLCNKALDLKQGVEHYS